jgi:AsmA protein
MLKALKIFCIVIGVIIVLIIAAVLIIPQVINPNDYRHDIEQAVAEHTDRTMTIKGDIELSLFPWLGVEVGKTTLSNAPGFGSKPFATIDDMEVRVRLLSLIGDHPEVGTLKLKGLKLNLARNASGKTNWQDLIGGGEPGSGGSGGGRFGHYTIDSVKLGNATINWNDAVNHTHYRIRDANVTVGKVEKGKPFPVKLNFAVDRTKPVLHADVGIKATATIFPKDERYRLDNGAVQIAARGAHLPAQPTRIKAKWKMLGLKRARGTFQLSGLTVNTMGITAHAKLHGQGLNAKPQIRGHLTIPDFSPREVLSRMGRRMNPRDDGVLRHATVSSDIEATSNSAQLDHFQATLDDSHFEGRIAIANFKKGAIHFNLAADQFDTDRYLPATTKKAENVPLAAIDNIRLPGNRLRGLNLDGQLTIGHFTLLGMSAQDIALGVNAANGEMKFSPLSAKLYGGTYKGTLTAEAVGNSGMKLAASQTLDGIHFGPLLQDLLGKKLLSGTASLDIAFNGKGTTVGGLKKTLDGKIKFGVKHGAIEGIDLWSAIRRAEAALKHKKPPKNTGPKRTEFVTMGGSGVIENGVINNNDFHADLPFIHLAGHGTVNLVERDVDYDLKAKIIKIPKIEGRKQLKKLDGHTIPIHFEGDFRSLTAFPHLGDVLKSKVNDEKHKLENKAKDRAKDKKHELEDKVKDRVKHLFHHGDDGKG